MGKLKCSNHPSDVSLFYPQESEETKSEILQEMSYDNNIWVTVEKSK